MYTIDARDEVLERTDAPQSSVGAPRPVVLSNERGLALAYYIQEPEWDETMPLADEAVALVRFERSLSFMFGLPNDEAIAGHPLAVRGLAPYGVFEVKSSSWTRTLERMNAVHPHHRPEHYARLKHIIFTFHDNTFECIAEGFTATRARVSPAGVLPAMAALLDQ
jgi:hypothetical protein